MISLKDAEKLIKYCRKVIEKKLKGKDIDELKEFNEKLGVFVTLYRKGMLRGCIGYPEPIYSLNKGIKEAAINAAFSDPRFLSMRSIEEMKDTEIEISILTKPKLITVKDQKEYADKIEIGKDGLIVKTRFASGLLLPQVASENNWDPEEFLGQTCMKGRLDFTAWLDSKIKIYKFQAQIFKEKNGKVVEIKN